MLTGLAVAILGEPSNSVPVVTDGTLDAVGEKEGEFVVLLGNEFSLLDEMVVEQ